MVHSRTIREAAAHFRKTDPHTGLTETAIRNLLRQGRVPCARVGRKYLVTIEALEAYLAGNVENARYSSAVKKAGQARKCMLK